MLFEESGILWACEADTLSLITKYILHKSLDVPIMMSNVYPQLVGQAALKHEKIESFLGEINITARLSDFGYQGEHMETIVKETMNSVQCQFNPRKPSEEDIAAIVRRMI